MNRKCKKYKEHIRHYVLYECKLGQARQPGTYTVEKASVLSPQSRHVVGSSVFGTRTFR